MAIASAASLARTALIRIGATVLAFPRAPMPRTCVSIPLALPGDVDDITQTESIVG
jgi:hypothetical protein